MNKSQSKYYNTARLMNEALIILLEKKDYEFITVKEICEKAGVNRSTFYLHYETMNDLLQETIEYTMSRMYGRFHGGTAFNIEKIASSPPEDLVFITSEYLVPYLDFVKENKRFFSAAVSQPVPMRSYEIFNAMYDSIFNPILSRYNVSERDKKYTLGFFVNGTWAVIMAWIQDDCKDEISHIAELIIGFVQPYRIRRSVNCANCGFLNTP